jgi:hypothetical protein
MKKNLVFPVLAVALLLGFGSVGFASTFTFEDTMVPDPNYLDTSGSLSWTHDLTPYLTGGEIGITHATLQLGMTISGENPFVLGLITGDNNLVGGFSWGSWGSTGDNETLLTPTFTLNQIALNAIQDWKMDTVLQLLLSGTATVNSSTLSVSGPVVPIPTALLLLGSGIVCVVSYRRKSRA